MKSALTKYIGVVGIAVMLPAVVSAATLSVSPASQSVKTGDTFTVTVRLDTQGASIDGVDLRYLNFNSTLLQVRDANASQPGTQITADNLMPITAVNSADNTGGKILFSQLAAGGTKYKGSGILATISFKAIAPGTAALTFNHTPKSTTDSNVAASGGDDLLTAVINGSYTISGAGGKTTTVITPPKTPGNALPEKDQAPLPETDTTPFEFSEKLSFWQQIRLFLSDYFTSFTTRLGSIFK